MERLCYILIALLGLSLPVVSGIRGDMVAGDITPFYLRADISLILFIMGVYVIPILLCYWVCHWHALDIFRYLPIVLVYLLIYYGNYDDSGNTDALWIMEIMSVALVSIPVFFYGLILTVIIALVYYYLFNAQNYKNDNQNTTRKHAVQFYCKFLLDDFVVSFKRLTMLHIR